jgi:uncharacterized membrane protein YphA (DoxX/SURF4 family)
MLKLKNLDLGLLLIRLGLAAVFIAFGIAKFSDLEGTVGFFASLGFPAVAAYLVAVVEVLGGLAMLVGVWTDLAGVLLAVIMLVAIFTVTGAKGFMGGWDYNLILLVSSLGVAFAGPGKYALRKES